MKRTKNNFLKIFGVFLIFVGIVIILHSLSGDITGYVIAEKWGLSSFSLIGLLIVIIGFFIFEFAQSSLENFIYKGDKYWNIRDNELILSNKGYLSVPMFEREIKNLKGDKELLKIVRDAYAHPLLELADKNIPEKSKLAKRCLEVLGINYEQDNNSKESLDSKQKKEIKNAFKSYTGNLTSSQKKILNKYDLYLDKKSKEHFKIISKKTRKKIPISKTPSDSKAGINIAYNLIKLIEFDKGSS